MSSPTTGSPDDHEQAGSPDTQKATADVSRQPRRRTLAGLAHTLDDLRAVLVSAQAVIIAGTAVVVAIIAFAAIFLRTHPGPVSTQPSGTPPTEPAPAASSSGSTSSPPTGGSTGCLDQLTVPPTSGTHFLISATLTCPVQAGNTIFLVSEIKDADGRGDTEYYLVTSWQINPRSSQEQRYCSHASAGITRYYYLISVSDAQLAQINASTLPDGGATTLANAQVVSSHQPNKSNGPGGSC